MLILLIRHANSKSRSSENPPFFIWKYEAAASVGRHVGYPGPLSVLIAFWGFVLLCLFCDTRAVLLMLPSLK